MNQQQQRINWTRNESPDGSLISTRTADYIARIALTGTEADGYSVAAELIASGGDVLIAERERYSFASDAEKNIANLKRRLAAKLRKQQEEADEIAEYHARIDRDYPAAPEGWELVRDPGDKFGDRFEGDGFRKVYPCGRWARIRVAADGSGEFAASVKEKGVWFYTLDDSRWLKTLDEALAFCDAAVAKDIAKKRDEEEADEALIAELRELKAKSTSERIDQRLDQFIAIIENGKEKEL